MVVGYCLFGNLPSSPAYTCLNSYISRGRKPRLVINLGNGWKNGNILFYLGNLPRKGITNGLGLRVRFFMKRDTGGATMDAT